MIAAVAGLALSVAPFAVPQAARAEVTASVRITMVDGATGDPVVGACLDVWGYEDASLSLAGQVCAESSSSVLVVTPDRFEGFEQIVVKARTDELYVESWYPSAVVSWDATPLAPGADVEMRLTPAGVLSGTLTSPDGAPVEFADVAAQDTDAAVVAEGFVQDGRWRLKVPAGTYLVQFQRDGRLQYAKGVASWTAATTYDVALGQEVVVDDVFLADGEAGKATVTGTVREAVTGRVLSGMCVSSTFDGGWGEAGTSSVKAQAGRRVAHQAMEACPEGSVTTGEDGTYRLPVDLWVLEPVRVLVSDPSGGHTMWTSDEVTLSVASVVDGVDAVLTPAGSVRGRVVDAATGAPMEGVCPGVWSGRSSGWLDVPRTCSDADGWWTASGLAPQRITVSLRPELPYVEMFVPGVASHKAAMLISVVSGRQVTAPVTRLRRGGVLTGKVTDRAGKPVKGVIVSTEGWGQMSGPEGPRATTDASGIYRIEGLAEGTPIVQFAGWEGRGEKWAWQWSGGASDPASATGVRIAYDTTTTLDAVLRLGAKVEVTLSGATLPHDENYILVSAYSAAGTHLGIAGWVQPGGGTMTLTSLPEGVVLLRAELRSGDRVKTWWYRAPGAAKGTKASPVVVHAGRTTPVSWELDW